MCAGVECSDPCIKPCRCNRFLSFLRVWMKTEASKAAFSFWKGQVLDCEQLVGVSNLLCKADLNYLTADSKHTSDVNFGNNPLTAWPLHYDSHFIHRSPFSGLTNHHIAVAGSASREKKERSRIVWHRERKIRRKWKREEEKESMHRGKKSSPWGFPLSSRGGLFLCLSWMRRDNKSTDTLSVSKLAARQRYRKAGH